MVRDSILAWNDGQLQAPRDDQIAQSRQAVDSDNRYSRSNHPQHGTIASIPVETIQHIFLELVTTSRDRQLEQWSAFESPLYQWLAITHVCRYWRQVCLETPQLWTYIYTLKLDCIRAFLARSKQLPLYIECFVDSSDRPEDEVVDALRVLLPEAHRFSTFILQGFKPCSELLSRPFLRPALSLKLVKLDLLPDTPWRSFAIVWPNILDSNVVPSLETLTLTNFPFIPLQSMRFPGIRTLQIESPVNPPSSDDWASALTAMPLLEELILVSAVLPRPALTPASTIQVFLRHLKLLRFTALNDEDTGEVALLEQLDISEDTAISFISEADVPLLHHSQHIIDTILLKISRTDRKRVPVTLRIRELEGRVRVTLWDKAQPHACSRKAYFDTEMDPGPNVIFDLGLWAFETDGLVAQVCQMLQSTFLLSKVEVLEFENHLFDEDDNFDIWRYRRILEPMINLHTLFVSGSYLAKFIHQLLITKSDGESEYPFPLLERLSLFDTGRGNKFFKLADIVYTLQKRKYRGSVLDSIQLCSLVHNQPQEIRQIQAAYYPMVPRIEIHCA